MNIVRASETPCYRRLWERLLIEDELQYPLYSPLNIEYLKEYAQDSRFEDVSFVVEEKGVPIMGVCMALRAHLDGRRELSGFGRPIGYFESRRANPSSRKGAAGVLREELQRIFRDHSFSLVTSRELRPAMSPVGECLMDIGARATPFFTKVIDLTASELTLRNQVRKSYKSLINWGTKHLNLCLLDHATVDPEAMEEFRLLHVEAAGRQTRSRRSWELEYEMVRQKEAFAIVGKMDGTLVTASLFVHSPGYCYYGVSASKRELFEKPISHCVIWMAMLHSKNLGCRFFETGEQLFPNQVDSPPTSKEMGINTFKRGFGGETYFRLNVVWKK